VVKKTGGSLISSDRFIIVNISPVSKKRNIQKEWHEATKPLRIHCLVDSLREEVMENPVM